MGLEIYDLLIPALENGLAILGDYLDQAEMHVQRAGIDPRTLIDARLAPDMLPLSGQIQRASDTAKGSVGRLSSLPPPPFADVETTFAELKERLERTVTFVTSVPRTYFVGSELREVRRNSNGGEVVVRGDRYLLYSVLPNFWFHVSTVDALLRHNGVALVTPRHFPAYDASYTAA